MGGWHIPLSPAPDGSTNLQRFFQMNYLETFEDMKDKAEQESANSQADNRHWHWHQPHMSASALATDCDPGMIPEDDIVAEEEGGAADDGADSAFF
jgi:predicted type IV restriction endonuclease